MHIKPSIKPGDLLKAIRAFDSLNYNNFREFVKIKENTFILVLVLENITTQIPESKPSLFIEGKFLSLKEKKVFSSIYQDEYEIISPARRKNGKSSIGS